jgi:hypothetical protein
VIVGAYVSQTLQRPLGLDGENDTLLFWAFFLSVMALLAGALIACAQLARSVGHR